MNKPFYRKPAKPTREVKARVSNPSVEFAKLGNMITEQEYEEAYKGNTHIPTGANYIQNLNADLPNFPTGTKQKLYPNRGIIKTAKDFLDFTG